VPNPSDPQAFNRYSYVSNNPLRFVDPSGHAQASPDDLGSCGGPCAPGKPIDPPKPREEISPCAAAWSGTACDIVFNLTPNTNGGTGETFAIQPVPGGLILMAKKQSDERDRDSGSSSAGAPVGGGGGTDKESKLTKVLNELKETLRRPYLRVNTKKSIHNAANRASDGTYLDPNTGDPIEGKFHYGHKYGHEHRRLTKEAEQLGMDQRKFNEWVNSHPEWFQIEDAKSNMSHNYEKPGR
jgi:hypothetical protein